MCPCRPGWPWSLPDAISFFPLIEEIFPWGGVQPVPYTQPWFLGVANLRGALTGVVDLAGLLGAAQMHTEQALAESSLLAFNGALDVNAALLVDRLSGLRGMGAFVASEPPEAVRPLFRHHLS